MTIAKPTAPRAMNSWGPFALLALFLAIQLFGLTRVHRDWWFEDDVYQRHFISQCAEPAAYLFEPDRNYAFNMGRMFTPLLALSLYLDYRIAAESPAPAYWHTMFSLALTVLLLYLLFLRFFSKTAALFMAGLWLFLPATVVVTEFIATRHYLEGLALSLAALLLALRTEPKNQAYRWLTLLAIAFLFYLAALAKEVYVAFTFFALTAIFLTQRRVKALIVLFLAGGLYAGHRLWFVQGLSRDSFDFDLHQLTDFLWLPFTFTGGWAGYFFVLPVVIAAGVTVVKKRIGVWHAILILGGIGVLLISILPVFRHLVQELETPGTWRRLVFLAHTVLFPLGVWFCVRAFPSRVNQVLALILTCVVLIGGYRTANHWDKLKQSYRGEAEFYLNNPDKLLYTELAAPWFIITVHDLYGGDRVPHVISWNVISDRGVIRRLLEEHDEVWRYTPEGYRPDPDLHRFLWEKNDAMARPFTEARGR